MNNQLTQKAKKAKTGKTAVILVLLFAVYGFLLVLNNFIPSTSFTLMLIPVLQKGAIYSIVCVSMNLLNGFTGLFSLGQAGFMLIGAYAYAIFTIPSDQHAAVYQYFNGGIIKFSVTEILSNAIGETAGNIIGAIIVIIIAGIISAICAALIGIPVLRFKSDYLAIATLGFAEIIRAICQWNGIGSVTNGSNLLRKYTNLNSLKIVTGDTQIKLALLFPFVIATLCVVFIVMLIRSTYGRAFKAIRDDEIAAEAMGIPLFKHKMISFVTSSFFAGIGGALLAMYQTTIQATPFKTAMTYEILLIVVIGGIGSVSGSCIGSFLYIAASEWWLRFLDSGKLGSLDVPIFRDGFRKVVFSIIIMVIVLFFRKGIMGDKELPDALSRLFGRFKKKTVTETLSEGGEQ